MTTKIEVFYTGGGITLAEADIDEKHYAVVSSDAPEYLSVYAYADGAKTYLPENMVSSAPKEKLQPKNKVLYCEMLNKLKTA